jgi:hypothetical protein
VATNYNEQDRPVQDLGLRKPVVPYRAGGKDQGDLATRKRSLTDSGTIGFIPGHAGEGPGSSLRAGGVHEEPPGRGASAAAYGEMVPDDDDRRPMPRDVPVHAQTTHMGNIVRFLDGHSEIVRSRPHLVAKMNDPDTHPDDREQIKMEIAHRDAINNHRYW